jgi:hypothetical protein
VIDGDKTVHLKVDIIGSSNRETLDGPMDLARAKLATETLAAFTPRYRRAVALCHRTT